MKDVLDGILRDFADKQLWPISFGLIVLAIGVPVALSRGADTVTSAGSGPAPVGASMLQPRASVVQPASAPPKAATGPLRNPLVRNTREKTDAELAGAQEGASGAASMDNAAVGAGGPDGAASPPVGSTPPNGKTPGKTTGGESGKDKPTPKPSGKKGFQVAVRFGTGTLKRFDDVQRLAPLPSTSEPTLVFLGVLEGGKTAIFMVSEPATAVGDGTCRPTPQRCDTLELQAGDTQYLDIMREDKSVPYRLDVTEIKQLGAGGDTITRDEADEITGSTASASAGRAAVRRARSTSARTALDQYRYVPSLGVIVRRTVSGDRGEGALAVRQSGTTVSAVAGS